MHMQLFYDSHIDPSAATFVLKQEESRHLVTIFRKSEGDTLYLTNGRGWLFTATLLHAHPRNCEFKITQAVYQQPRKYYLHIAVAPTKMLNRLEWFVEKATEIGVHEITPLVCEHSERRALKRDRLEKIMVAAMKQSLQCYLPRLNEPVAFADFVERPFRGQLFIAHCREGLKSLLAKEALPAHPVTVLIGPEGDFSEKEIQKALQREFLPVSLGEVRLRTETAALATCHTVALINL